MLGKRGPQRGLFEADTAYGAFVGGDSCYGWLASQRGELFRDEGPARLYVLNNGRPSVPPSLLATALVLQTYDRVSDDEAKQRADSDERRFVEEIVADADRVVWRFTVRGTHTGPLQGLAPTGRAMTIGGMVLTRFDDGVWAEDYATWDALGMLQQLGAVPVAA